MNRLLFPMSCAVFLLSCAEPPAEVMTRPGYCLLGCSDTSDSDTGLWLLCAEEDCSDLAEFVPPDSPITIIEECAALAQEGTCVRLNLDLDPRPNV